MPAVHASAPGKAILFGEHAVVYHRPAIAVPIEDVQARVYVLANPLGNVGQIQLEAPAIHLDAELAALEADHPLRLTLDLLKDAMRLEHLPAMKLRIVSSIPVAAGLGSGAAVTVAMLRAVSIFLGRLLPDSSVCALAYEVEKKYHGNPSGIDNTVITYRKPVYFLRGEPIQILRVTQPFTLLIADSGIPSSTAKAVSEVRLGRQHNPQQYEALFDHIGELVEKARQFIENGPADNLGALMTHNHQLLRELGVSHPKLDQMVEVALKAGALGAKLSGSGQGGNIIALVRPENAQAVQQALRECGAVNLIITRVTGKP